MRRDLTSSALAVLVLTVLLGVVYPLATTGVSQVLWPNKADGSQVERDGKTVGSRLIGQDFRKPVLDRAGEPKVDADGNPVLEPDERYFQSRPSATGYSPNVTYFNNLGPNNAELRDLFADNLAAYLDLEHPYNPGLARGDVPADAVQTAASGVDPHISPDNARIQARRIAYARRVSLDRVLALVDENTDGRGLGVFGEPGVNVLDLNLALDEEAQR
ncbi:MAG: potassium-transporting ATPase subunit C [Actinomycetota bacterium]|nr:potassium-transporting ATPase subunit C [Actinomycetota bacterium]